MLSYRHAFHAGNHADVLKHTVLCQVLAYLAQKDKPFLYVDTHAGAGLFDLTSEWAQKNREHEDGIGRIWQRDDLPAALAAYVRIVRELNPSGELRQYPGSPWLAHRLLRPGDSARLYELHSTDYPALAERFAGQRRIKVEKADGFAALKAVLPPAERRGVVLIDPSYEVKRDYQVVVEAVRGAVRRFATGCYLLWYPVLDRAAVQRLERELADSGIPDILLAELTVRADAEQAGLTGSGMIVVNPPWRLAEVLEDVLPWLSERLAAGKGAGHRLRWLAGEKK